MLIHLAGFSLSLALITIIIDFIYVHDEFLSGVLRLIFVMSILFTISMLVSYGILTLSNYAVQHKFEACVKAFPYYTTAQCEYISKYR